MGNVLDGAVDVGAQILAWRAAIKVTMICVTAHQTRVTARDPGLPTVVFLSAAPWRRCSQGREAKRDNEDYVAT